jgi:DhnA family fructose-bisphosphate aldolase class Ia
MDSTGKSVRLSRLLPGGRTVMVPFDDALISGPHAGLADTVGRAGEVAAGGADAILGFRKLHERCVRQGLSMPFVVNLTASTVFSAHTRKVAVGSVEAALRTGCDGVAVHVNVTDRHEGLMLSTLGAVSDSCQQWGMPLLAIMYPRQAAADGTDDNHLDRRASDRAGYAGLVRHAVRIAVELGADIVKTQYTGDPESFATVVEVAMGVPVITAGGPRTPIPQALRNAHDAVSAGATGVCFGRQTYNRTDVTAFVRALRLVVRDGRDPAGLVTG